VETVWSLVIVVIAAAAAGLVVWAVDRRHSAYGIMFPVAAAVAAACLVWIVVVWAGAGYIAGLTWLPWVAPIAGAIAAAVAVPAVVGRRRGRHDVEELTRVLRNHRA
jgi:hypothetical protein